jgi:hypothetical protein
VVSCLIKLLAKSAFAICLCVQYFCCVVIIIIIIIIIIIYCNWVVTRWQWLVYMYTKYETGYY